MFSFLSPPPSSSSFWKRKIYLNWNFKKKKKRGNVIIFFLSLSLLSYSLPFVKHTSNPGPIRRYWLTLLKDSWKIPFVFNVRVQVLTKAPPSPLPPLPPSPLPPPPEKEEEGNPHHRFTLHFVYFRVREAVSICCGVPSTFQQKPKKILSVVLVFFS